MLEIELKSQVPEVRWPAILVGEAAHYLSLVAQLEKTQWWEAERIREHQFRQAQRLLRFAWDSVPFYRARFESAGLKPNQPLTQEAWARLPLLTRGDLQTCRVRSDSRLDHGPVGEGRTSGSTGQPVEYLTTQVTRYMWQAITVRHWTWHAAGVEGKLCAIRPRSGPTQTQDKQAANWGKPLALLFRTGPAAEFDCRQDAAILTEWLLRQNGDYLITLPSTLEAMVRVSVGRRLSLKGVTTYAEMLKPEVRELVRSAWGLPVFDMYSSQETGYIALQCPQHEHYHVQAESLLVEILDEAGRPCRAGQTGRVILTSLLNFASPLIRYDIGDYAEVGEACACGRGLPVLRRIMGRVRNLITLPDGRRYWPVLYASSWSHIAPIRQMQLIQKTPHRFDARMVAERELTANERTALISALRKSLGYPFEFEFEYLREPIRNPNGKFESIISEVPA